jgi:hypothetical protein
MVGEKWLRTNKTLSQHILSGDHIFGLVPLMASLLNGAGGVTEGGEDPRLNLNTETAVCLPPSFGLSAFLSFLTVS